MIVWQCILASCEIKERVETSTVKVVACWDAPKKMGSDLKNGWKVARFVG